MCSILFIISFVLGRAPPGRPHWQREWAVAGAPP